MSEYLKFDPDELLDTVTQAKAFIERCTGQDFRLTPDFETPIAIQSPTDGFDDGIEATIQVVPIWADSLDSLDARGNQLNQEDYAVYYDFDSYDDTPIDWTRELHVILSVKNYYTDVESTRELWCKADNSISELDESVDRVSMLFGTTDILIGSQN